MRDLYGAEVPKFKGSDPLKPPLETDPLKL